MSAGRKNNSDKKDWNTPPKYITPIKQFFGGGNSLLVHNALQILAYAIEKERKVLDMHNRKK